MDVIGAWGPPIISFSYRSDILLAAMYKGDSRTRTMGIYVDGNMQTEWTSSGTTTDFENVNLDVIGEVVELRGVLGDSDWISIMEVSAERTSGDNRVICFGLQEIQE